MTVSIQQVSNTSTFYFWKTQTNLLANAMSTVVVSTNSNTAVGNAAISGTFSANTLNSVNLTVNGVSTLKGISANGDVGTAGQVLTSNGSSTYWSTSVGTVYEIGVSGGLTGGPITTTGTISLDLYSGDVALNASYPIGTTIAVYTGINLGGVRNVNTTQPIYVDTNGFNTSTGTALTGTWRNRGLSGTDYRSPTETRYYYLYQRVA